MDLYSNYTLNVTIKKDMLHLKRRLVAGAKQK